MIIRCRCYWNPIGTTQYAQAENCPNSATQEDGLCDWCAPAGARTSEQIRQNPKAIVVDEDRVLLSAMGEVHDTVFREGGKRGACWTDGSDRVIGLFMIDQLAEVTPEMWEKLRREAG